MQIFSSDYTNVCFKLIQIIQIIKIPLRETRAWIAVTHPDTFDIFEIRTRSTILTQIHYELHNDIHDMAAYAL